LFPFRFDLQLFADDEPIYEPPSQPDPATPLQPQPGEDPALIAERARAEAYREIAMGRQAQPEPDVVPDTRAPLPTNPLDLLDEAGKLRLEQMRLTDAAQYTAEISSLAVRLAEARVARQAEPIIAGQAGLIISNFKSRMMSQDKYGAQVAPLFDSVMSSLGNGVRNLVGMTPKQQEAELALRWNSERSKILEREIKTQAKPEPPPLGGSNGAQPMNDPTTYETQDPIIAALHRKYKFTPEQLAEINAGSL